jgi:hypothetical protein
MLHLDIISVGLPLQIKENKYMLFINQPAQMENDPTDKDPTDEASMEVLPREIPQRERRSMLFNLEQPITVPTEEFNKQWWPLVDNVWTSSYNGILSTGDVHDPYRVYVCRLSKPRESSSRSSEVPAKKRRNTTVRVALECRAAIKVIHLVSTQMTLVERHNDSPPHAHTLELSDSVKIPTEIRDTIAEEATKAYHPPAIVTVVKEIAEEKGLEDIAPHISRTVVANIQQGLRRSHNAFLAGAADCETDINDCRFYSRYLLPCRHILHAHEYTSPAGALITTNDWKHFQHMFEELGMEVYQTREWVQVPVVVETEERKLAAYRLRANELLENLRNEFWKAVDSGKEEGIREYLGDLELFMRSRHT